MCHYNFKSNGYHGGKLTDMDIPIKHILQVTRFTWNFYVIKLAMILKYRTHAFVQLTIVTDVIKAENQIRAKFQALFLLGNIRF